MYLKMKNPFTAANMGYEKVQVQKHPHADSITSVLWGRTSESCTNPKFTFVQKNCFQISNVFAE